MIILALFSAFRRIYSTSFDRPTQIHKEIWIFFTDDRKYIFIVVNSALSWITLKMELKRFGIMETICWYYMEFIWLACLKVKHMQKIKQCVIRTNFH